MADGRGNFDHQLSIEPEAKHVQSIQCHGITNGKVQAAAIFAQGDNFEPFPQVVGDKVQVDPLGRRSVVQVDKRQASLLGQGLGNRSVIAAAGLNQGVPQTLAGRRSGFQAFFKSSRCQSTMLNENFTKFEACVP